LVLVAVVVPVVVVAAAPAAPVAVFVAALVAVVPGASAAGPVLSMLTLLLRVRVELLPGAAEDEEPNHRPVGMCGNCKLAKC
jgi:hypothetical protein